MNLRQALRYFDYIWVLSMYANLLQLFTHNPKVLDETKKSIDNFRLLNGLALHLLSKSKNHAARLIKLKV